VLKNIFNIEHARARSKINFLSNILSALIAYAFESCKPHISTINLVPA